jgi:pimeloyl-ACP methyl ester carboxylesterase
MGERRDLYVDAGGLRFRVREWGPPQGRPLVFLHGAYVSSLTYEVLLRRLAEVSGRRVVGLDQRGHGETSFADDYSWGGWVGDVDAVAVELELGRFDLVGHSMGAHHAALFAGTRPERVTSLVLLDGGFPMDQLGNEDYWGRIASSLFPDDGFGAVEDFVSAMCTGFPRTEPDVIREAWAYFVADDGGRYRWPFRSDPAVSELRNNPGEAKEKALRAAVTCPVLVARAELSELSQDGSYCDVAAEYRHGTATLLAGTGHNLCFENLSGTVDLVTSFVSRPSNWSRAKHI